MALAQKDEVVIHQKKQAMPILSFPIRIVNRVGGRGKKAKASFYWFTPLLTCVEKEKMSATGAKRWAA